MLLLCTTHSQLSIMFSSPIPTPSRRSVGHILLHTAVSRVCQEVARRRAPLGHDRPSLSCRAAASGARLPPWHPAKSTRLSHPCRRWPGPVTTAAPGWAGWCHDCGTVRGPGRAATGRCPPKRAAACPANAVSLNSCPRLSLAVGRVALSPALWSIERPAGKRPGWLAAAG